MKSEQILPILVPILTALAGAGGATFTDVSGAKAWREQEAAKIADAVRLEQRVVALEAQQSILLQLVDRCGGR